MDAAIRAEFTSLPTSQRSRALQLFDAGQLMRGATSSSTRIANLVKSLKAYSRQDSGETLDIQLIDGLQDTLHILANRLKRVEVTVDAEPVPPVMGNTAELNQVWTNLIVNACDAMGDEGRLRIVIRSVNDRVVVEIHDSGTGISEEHLGSLFDAHFTTRNSSGNFGLGLGLAITRDIVAKPGNSDVLKGAKFTVSIPAKVVQQ
jgi:signal transduction histidine kinase